jgi:hypothetical protein
MEYPNLFIPVGLNLFLWVFHVQIILIFMAPIAIGVPCPAFMAGECPGIHSRLVWAYSYGHFMNINESTYLTGLSLLPGRFKYANIAGCRQNKSHLKILIFKGFSIYFIWKCPYQAQAMEIFENNKITKDYRPFIIFSVVVKLFIAEKWHTPLIKVSQTEKCWSSN